MSEQCQHARQRHTQIYVLTNGGREPSSRYIDCLDCGARTIQTWPAAFLAESYKRVSRVERDDSEVVV